MIEPRPSVTRFVNAAARAERKRAGDALEFPIAQRLLTRLHRELGKLIGTAGFDALLGRSLVLARRARPGLTGVTSASGGKLEGLDALTREQPDFDDALLTIVAHFVELLVKLIGEDLAMGMLRDLWPTTSSLKEP